MVYPSHVLTLNYLTVVVYYIVCQLVKFHNASCAFTLLNVRKLSMQKEKYARIEYKFDQIANFEFLVH